MFDMKDLANSLVNNGTWGFAPVDTFRMGIVAGYDPAFSFDDGANTFPALSVQLAGDERMMHGFRFAEHYVPHLGDTVWVLISPDDHWVVGALATSATERAKRSPMTYMGSATAAGQTNPAVTTALLPNRLYRVEGQVHFTTSGSGANYAGQVSLKVTQPYSSTPLVLETRDVFPNNSYVVTGSQEWSITDQSKWSNGLWTATNTNSEYTWTLEVNSLDSTPSYASYNENNAYHAGDLVVDTNGHYWKCVQSVAGVWSSSATYYPGQLVLYPAQSEYLFANFNNQNISPATTANGWDSNFNTQTNVITSTPFYMPTWTFTGVFGGSLPTTPYFTRVTPPTITVTSSRLTVHDMGVAS